MGTARRWYFYLVSAMSLQAIVWAVIVILRNRSLDSVAFQAAVIIVGLPIFLLHYRWATRSEPEADSYGEDHLRLLYMLAMLAAFLMPIITNSTGFVQALLRMIVGIERSGPQTYYYTPPPNSEVMIDSAVAILVLGLFGFYHAYVVREEGLLSDEGVPTTLRRMFVYLFTAIGLAFFAGGLVQTIRWLLSSLGASTIVDPSLLSLTAAVAQLLTGLVVWLLFWRSAQQLFYSGREEERESALRKGYLYLVVFISTVTVVSDLTIAGAAQLRRLLGLDPARDTGIVLSSLVVGALVWAYHAYALREDSRAAPDVAAQAGSRRVYWYLVAAIGLLALLGGLAGIISVIINALGQSGVITDSLRETLSWSTAALGAGLLVWIVPWRKIQTEVELPDPAGIDARRASMRRYYLYGFILLATLTFLGCAVFLVYALISSALGIRTDDIAFSAIAQALAFAVMATPVWLYHGSILRRDGALLQEASSGMGKEPEIAILDDADGRLGRQLRDALAKALPAAHLSAVGLTAAARDALPAGEGRPETAQIIKAADIIVGPWTVATPYAGPQPDEEGVVAAVAASLAHKVLIPRGDEHWDWAGVGGWNEETAVQQAVQAVKQVAAGEYVAAKKSLGVGRIILIIIGIFFLINLLVMLLRMFGFPLFY